MACCVHKSTRPTFIVEAVKALLLYHTLQNVGWLLETADQLDTVDIERSFVSNAQSKFEVDLISS